MALGSDMEGNRKKSYSGKLYSLHKNLPLHHFSVHLRYLDTLLMSNHLSLLSISRSSSLFPKCFFYFSSLLTFCLIKNITLPKEKLVTMYIYIYTAIRAQGRERCVFIVAIFLYGKGMMTLNNTIFFMEYII